MKKIGDKTLVIVLVILVNSAFTLLTKDTITIYLVGDSTCADKSPDAFPEMGWGTPFKTFFNENLKIENRAKNGRSTKSFIQEGRWGEILETLKKGDYVFIQFGHNDEVQTKKTATKPNEFQGYLRQYVNETRKKGANPVLLTPVSRRSFENGKLKDTHAQYAQLLRDVAVEMDVPMIDMTEKSMKLLNDWGVANSQLLFHHLKPGEHPNYPNGREDNTHFNELGARKMAQLVLDGIEELNLDILENVVDPEKK
jgi:lysophospholipase L1-like esterase